MKRTIAPWTIAAALVAALCCTGCAGKASTAVMEPDPLPGAWSLQLQVVTDGKIAVFQPAVAGGGSVELPKDAVLTCDADGTWTITSAGTPALGGAVGGGAWQNDTDAFLDDRQQTYDAWLENVAAAAEPGAIVAAQHYLLAADDGAQYAVTVALFKDAAATLTQEGANTFFAKWRRAV